MASDTSSTVPRIVGNYELISKIAEGGMGAVFKGRDQTSGLIQVCPVFYAEALGSIVNFGGIPSPLGRRQQRVASFGIDGAF